MIRAVIDTNVLLSARRSSSLSSPNAEIVHGWTAGEFTWLVSTDAFEEYAGKLREFGLLTADTVELLARLMVSGETVEIRFFHVRHYPYDPDDTVFLLTALNGGASHPATCDEDLENITVFYPEFVHLPAIGLPGSAAEPALTCNRTQMLNNPGCPAKQSR